jgi:hypothetical protein
MTYTPNRRRFLIDSGLTALDSTRAFGANDKLRVGVIDAGGRMRQLLDSADSTGVPFEIAFVSDVLRAASRRGEDTRECHWSDEAHGLSRSA